MQSVGQSWLVLELTNSPFKLGMIGTLQFAQIPLFSRRGGAISDRVRKRRLIIGTQSALMVQALALSALVWSGHLKCWHVGVLAPLYGLANTLDMPARQSFIVDLVGRPGLTSAIALNSAMFKGGGVVGPAAAGLLVGRYGTAAAFLANGLSFVAVILALLAMRSEGQPHPRAGAGLLEEMREGLRYAAGTPRINLVLGLLMSVSLFVINYNVFVPLIARDVLHEGAHGFGLLMSALGLGAMLGALGLALLGVGRPPLRMVVAPAVVVCAATLALAWVHDFDVALAVLAVIGCAQIVFTSNCNSTVQLTVPDALRGRLMGLYALVFVGVTPIGSFLVGTIAERLGVLTACAVAGGAGLVSVVALTLAWRWRRRRSG